jgi:probable rRNA maturation factor
MAALTVDIQVACDDVGIPSEADIQSWIEDAVRGAGVADTGNVEVAVRVVDASEIQMLNSLYRKQDKATNVLSFPADEIDGRPHDASRLLGDVVICASVVVAEAEEQNKPLADHWGHMLVHGTLHLLGFDHESGAEAARMESLEAKILAARNVTDPYAES